MTEAERIVKRFPFDERRKAVRTLRRESGLTQTKLASRAGITQSTLANFEAGQFDLSPAAFARVQNILTDVLVAKKSGKTNLRSLLYPRFQAVFLDELAHNIGTRADLSVKLAAEVTDVLQAMIRGELTQADVVGILAGAAGTEDLPKRLEMAFEALLIIEDHVKIVREGLAAERKRRVGKK